MDLQVIESEDALATRSDAWQALQQSDPSAGIFVSPAWVLNWLAHFRRGRPLRFLWLSESGAPVAIFPFIADAGRWRRLGVRKLTWCVNSSSVRGGYLALPGRAGDALEAVADYLRESREWDIVVGDGDPADLAWFRDERLVRRSATWSHSCFALTGSWDDYFKRLPLDFRRNLRRSDRDLRHRGELDVEFVEDARRVEEAMSLMFAIDAASWKAQGGETMAADTNLRSYYMGIARAFSAAGKLLIAVLRAAGEPIAVILALHDKQVLYTLKTSFSMAHGSARVSPGNLLMQKLLEHAWQRGYKGVDFVCRRPYTERWTDGAVLFRQDLLFYPGWYSRTVKALDAACAYAGRMTLAPAVRSAS